MSSVRYYRDGNQIVCYKLNINRIIGYNAGDPNDPKDWEPIDHVGSDEEAKECLANGYSLLGLERSSVMN